MGPAVVSESRTEGRYRSGSVGSGGATGKRKTDRSGPPVRKSSNEAESLHQNWSQFMMCAARVVHNAHDADRKLGGVPGPAGDAARAKVLRDVNPLLVGLLEKQRQIREIVGAIADKTRAGAGDGGAGGDGPGAEAEEAARAELRSVPVAVAKRRRLTP